MNWKSTLKTLALSAVLTSCSHIYIGPKIESIEEIGTLPQITDDSSLAKFYLSGNFQQIPLGSSGTEQFTDELEERVTFAYENYLSRKIKFPQINDAERGYILPIVPYGELELTEIQRFEHELNGGEKEAIIYLAERTEPKKINLESAEFKKLAVVLENPSENQQSFNSLNNHFKVGKPRYAAAILALGGTAHDYFFGQEINMDIDTYSFNRFIETLGHEVGHLLFFNEYKIYDFAQYNPTNLPINETACDILGERISKQILTNQIKKGSKLYQQIVADKERSQQINKQFQNFYDDFRDTPPNLRKKNRRQILNTYNSKLSGLLKRPVKINEAKLVLSARYSGDKDRYQRLDDLEKILGLEGFIEVINWVNNDQELIKIHNYARKHNVNSAAVLKSIVKENPDFDFLLRSPEF